MFIDAAEFRDKILARHFRRTLARLEGMHLGPVARDVQARGEPDAFVALGVFDELLQGTHPAWAADHAWVQADGHHAQTVRGLLVQHLEAFLHVLEKIRSLGEAR